MITGAGVTCSCENENKGKKRVIKSAVSKYFFIGEKILNVFLNDLQI
jgi:hypothetical protein